MEAIWKYSFKNKLGLSDEDLREKYVLLTEPANNPDVNREKMAHYMFNVFGVKGIMF